MTAHSRPSARNCAVQLWRPIVRERSIVRVSQQINSPSHPPLKRYQPSGLNVTVTDFALWEPSVRVSPVCESIRWTLPPPSATATQPPPGCQSMANTASVKLCTDRSTPVLASYTDTADLPGDRKSV